jgi:hypothetical protein
MVKPSLRALIAGFAVWTGALAIMPADGTEIDRDLRQTVRARQVLLQDPDLALLNLGVAVRDRVATLWGPVPSAQASLRAERALRRLVEIADVRNELEVNAFADTGVELVPSLGVPTYLPDQLPPTLPRVRPPLATATDRRAKTKVASPAPAARNQGQLEIPAIPVPELDVPARMPLAPEQKR